MALVAACSVGGAAVGLVASRRSRLSRSEALLLATAYGPGLGLGVVALAYFVARHVGASHPALATLALAAVIVASLLAVQAPRVATDRDRPIGGRTRWGWSVVIVLVVCELVACAHWTRTMPLGSYDAKAIWNVRALFLSRTEGDVREVFSEIEHGQPDYPLLLPAAIAAQLTVLGRESPAVAQGVGLVVLIGLSLLVFSGSRRDTAPGSGGWTLVLLFSTPAIWTHAFTQCADLPVAYFFLGSALGMASLLDRRRAPVPLAVTGFFLGCLMFTKNEGIVLAAVLAAAFAATGGWRALGPRQVVAAAAGAAWPVAAQVLFRVAWTPTNSVAPFLRGGIERATEPDRLTAVADAMADRLLPTGDSTEWALFWIVLAAALVLPWTIREIRRRRPVRFLTLVSLAVLGCWFVVYLCTPSDVHWHMRTSMTRLLLQLAPLAAVAWFPAALDPGQRRRQEASTAVTKVVPAPVSGSATPPAPGG